MVHLKNHDACFKIIINYNLINGMVVKHISDQWFPNIHHSGTLKKWLLFSRTPIANHPIY